MPYITDPVLFKQEQERRLVVYYQSNKVKLEGFGGKQRFIDWFINELNVHGNKCHYCKTSILDIRKLLNAGIINGRSVKGGGIRGSNFEVDRKNPFGTYNEHNCVLSCYYCNNDKSNTFNYETYLNIIGLKKGEALSILINRLENII